MPQLCSVVPVDQPILERTCPCPCHTLGDNDPDRLMHAALEKFRCKPEQVCCKHHGKAWPQCDNEPTPWLVVNGKKFRLACHGFKFSVLMIELHKKFGGIGKVVYDSKFFDQIFDRFEIQTGKPETVMEFITDFCRENNITIQEMPETA